MSAQWTLCEDELPKEEGLYLIAWLNSFFNEPLNETAIHYLVVRFVRRMEDYVKNIERNLIWDKNTKSFIQPIGPGWIEMDIENMDWYAVEDVFAWIPISTGVAELYANRKEKRQ